MYTSKNCSLLSTKGNEILQDGRMRRTAARISCSLQHRRLRRITWLDYTQQEHKQAVRLLLTAGKRRGLNVTLHKRSQYASKQKLPAPDRRETYKGLLYATEYTSKRFACSQPRESIRGRNSRNNTAHTSRRFVCSEVESRQVKRSGTNTTLAQLIH